MARATTFVVGVGQTSLTRSRLRAALGVERQVLLFERSEELWPVLGTSRVSAIVLSPSEALVDVAKVILDLTRRYPAVPVVLYCRASASACVQIADSYRAGAVALIRLDLDDTPAILRAIIETAVGVSTDDHILALLTVKLAASQLAVVRLCMMHDGARGSVGDIAKSMNVTRKTLWHRASIAAMPPPRTLVAWIRLLRCARTLGEFSRTVEQVAIDAGFSSGAGLHNMLYRYAGLSARELMQRGGFTYLIEEFTTLLQSNATTPEVSLADRGRKADKARH